MTDNGNYRNDDLDRALRDELAALDVPPPDPSARQRTIAMAREAFEAAQAGASRSSEQKTENATQGLFARLRLMAGKSLTRGLAMIPFNQRLFYSGVATAGVAAVAVGIAVQMLPPAPQTTAPFSMEAARTGTVSLGGPADVPEPETPGRAATLESDIRPPSLSEALKSESRVSSDVAAAAANGGAGAEQWAARARTAPETAAAAQSASPRSEADEVVVVTGHRLDQSASLAKVAPSRAQLRAAGVLDDAPAPAPGYADVGRDAFEAFAENPVKLVSEEPVSTFSADVDTASYSFVRRMLNRGVLPQGDAVRVEEMVNYFDYDYALPQSKAEPFQPTVAVSDSPWADGRKLMHIGIKGFDVAPTEKPRSNLVFLLDVSGSMNSPDKLPLVKQSMELLLSTLQPDDTVAIAVYAGAAGTVLEPTPVREKGKILGALRKLSAGGSTAGAQGIRLAYELAESQFDEDAVNRVILATDGDFNVGISNKRELQSYIERQRDSGIYLSVLGFGQGNYNDALMQTLAQNGNGVAAYIDTLSEAQKLLVDEATSTLFPIARDVKLQVEFNPATVAEYRLIGYETRHLNREDFNNDAVDAGDIGAGHSVTAIYEFTPVGSDARMIDDSRYAPRMESMSANGSEYAFLKIRYKLPEEDSSQLITRPVTNGDAIELGGEGIGREAGFATAVAAFAQQLKGGRYTGDYGYDDVIELAQQTRGSDPYGYRTEFIQLVRKAKTAAAMQAR